MTVELFDPYHANLEMALKQLDAYTNTQTHHFHQHNAFEFQLIHCIIPFINNNYIKITDTYPTIRSELVQAMLGIRAISDDAKYKLASHADRSLFPILLDDRHLQNISHQTPMTWLLFQILMRMTILCPN